MEDRETEIILAAELAAHKAAPLFNLFGWRYRDEKNPPSSYELENDIDIMLRDVVYKENYGAQRGRIAVDRHENEDGTFDVTVSIPLAHIYSVSK